MLLGFERAHFNRQLCRCDHINQKDKAPAVKLSAIAEVQIFGQGIVLPTAGFLNTALPPKASGTIEIKETTSRAARGLFKNQVAIQQNSLRPGEPRVCAIKMLPPGLNHSDARIRKIMNGFR